MVAAQSEVRELLDSWAAAIRARDIDRLMTLYDPGIVYFDVVPPLQYVGSDAVRRNFVRWFDSWSSPIGQDIGDVHLVANEDVALAYMLLRTSGTLKSGREVSYWVRVTVGCHLAGSRWLIAHEHVSLPVDVASGQVVMDLVP